jgi:hypothetical protein
MKFIDFSFGKSKHRDLVMRQTLENCGDVLLITAYSIERLGVDDIKLAACCILQQRLDSRSH